MVAKIFIAIKYRKGEIMSNIKKTIAVLSILIAVVILAKVQAVNASEPAQGLRCQDIAGCAGVWGCTGPGKEVVRCGLCCDGDGVAEVICDWN